MIIMDENRDEMNGAGVATVHYYTFSQQQNIMGTSFHNYALGNLNMQPT